MKKELFIYGTNIKVEFGHHIIVDGQAYTVTAESLPKLIRKKIIQFADPKPVDPYADLSTCPYWWIDTALEAIGLDYECDCLREFADSYTGIGANMITKAISDYFAENDDVEADFATDGYYLVSLDKLDCVKMLPEFASTDPKIVDRFAWFRTAEQAKFAIKVLNNWFEGCDEC